MTILVVDDELLIRKSLTRGLASKGHECVEAENGQVALDLVAKQSFDFIILDLIMPIKSGYDFISESSGSTPIFIISAFSGPELSAEYLKSDSRIQMFIKKPFNNLFETIGEILDHMEKKGN